MAEFGAFDGQEVMSEVLPKKSIWKKIANGWDKFDAWTDKLIEEHPEGCAVGLTAIIVALLYGSYRVGSQKGFDDGIRFGAEIGKLTERAKKG